MVNKIRYYTIDKNGDNTPLAAALLRPSNWLDDLAPIVAPTA